MNGMSIGQPLPRVDGRAKVTGLARYAAEFDQRAQAYAVIVTSTVGLGRVTRIDTARASAMPGVVAIISHLNAPRLPYRERKGAIDPVHGERLHVLQDDQVRFFGQPVAVVVANTLDQAEHAALAVRVGYQARPPATRIEQAEIIVPGGGSAGADSARGDADAALLRAPSRSMRPTASRAKTTIPWSRMRRWPPGRAIT